MRNFVKIHPQKIILLVLLTGIFSTGGSILARATSTPPALDPVAQAAADAAAKAVADAQALADMIAQGLCTTTGLDDAVGGLGLCCPCDNTRQNLVEQMDIYRRGSATQPAFLFGTYWNKVVGPGIQKYIARIVETTVTQTAMLGTLLDAQNNIRATGTLQKQRAAAALNYTPSESLCRFGSLSESLGADDINSRLSQTFIAGVGVQRNLGARETIAEAGAAGDIDSRTNDFTTEYCVPGQNNSGLSFMCRADTKSRFPSIAKDTRENKDIDYTQTIDSNSTLNIGSLTPDPGSAAKMDVINLGHNLYGSSQPSERPTEKNIKKGTTRALYMKLRSVAAARSVAQNTYAAITGMKALGSGASAQYMKSMYNQMGLTDAQFASQIGEKPSYYAQMEVLTKKLYQNPSFYVNLMEGKTNVDRQSGAMEGLELMQDRDIYQSMRRSEMLMALLVQMQARRMLSSAVQDVNTLSEKNKAP